MKRVEEKSNPALDVYRIGNGCPSITKYLWKYRNQLWKWVFIANHNLLWFNRLDNTITVEIEIYRIVSVKAERPNVTKGLRTLSRL